MQGTSHDSTEISIQSGLTKQEGKSRGPQALNVKEKGYLTACATLAVQSRQQTYLWQSTPHHHRGSGGGGGGDDTAMGKTHDSDEEKGEDEDEDSDSDSEDSDEDVSSDCLPWAARSFQQGLFTATAAAAAAGTTTTHTQRQRQGLSQGHGLQQGQGQGRPVSLCLPRDLALLVGSLSLQGGASTAQEYVDAVLVAAHHATTTAAASATAAGADGGGGIDNESTKGNGKGRGKGRGGSRKKQDTVVTAALALCQDELSNYPGWSFSSSSLSLSSSSSSSANSSRDTQMVSLLSAAMLSGSIAPVPFQVIDPTHPCHVMNHIIG